MSDSQTAEDTQQNDGFRRHWRTLISLLPYLWSRNRPGLRLRVVAALAALVLAKAASAVVPIFFGWTVDALDGKSGAAVAGKAGNGDGAGDAIGLIGTGEALLAMPLYLLLGYGLMRLASVLFQELREALFARVAQHAIRQVALESFQHLHRLSLRYHLARRTGGLSRIIERGVKGIEFLLSFMLFNILPTLLEILLVCGILWGLLDFSFAATMLLIIVTYITYTLTVTEWRLKFRRLMNDRDNDANSKAIDSLLNYETVKYFGAEEYEAKRFDGAMRGYEDAAVRSITSLSAVNIGQAFIISAGLVWVMLMAARGVTAGQMTIGDFVLVNTYLIQLYLPLNFLGFVYRQIRQSLTDMEQLFAILRIAPEITDRPDAPALDCARGKIEFAHVDFGYDDRRRILKDVNFSVPPGRTLAVVGPSGAGKSTIARLLFRFYDVDEGAVLIDGQDIRSISQDSLRAAIGIVPQDTVLFNETIRYNIAYARPGITEAPDDAGEEEIIAAAKLARVHDFIAALPDGYDTMVGERGLKLSGGEKQRVAIARAILKGPRVLLFDEATSALDSATEQEIQQSLRDVSRGRTTLVIAHRLSTVVTADDILVLQDGRVAERGRHQDLLALNGLYADMWRRQQERKRQHDTLS